MTYKYKTIAIGGTFDLIHKGHRALLQRGFDTGEKVIIGITSDEFVKGRGKKPLHNFTERKRTLESYLKETFPNRDYFVTQLDRNFGPGMFTSQIEAIAVSEETEPQVAEANVKRRKLGLPDLKVEVVPLIMAKDNNKISSSRIRAREIDAEGNPIVHLKDD